jgi:hypothetical protein
VKVVSAPFTEYLHLARFGDRWLIVNGAVTNAGRASEPDPCRWHADEVILACHTLIYSDDADATRALLPRRARLPSVDAGTGDQNWLIFQTGPSELGVHPTAGEGYSSPRHHAISFIVDDLESTMAELRDQGRGVQLRARRPRLRHRRDGQGAGRRRRPAVPAPAPDGLRALSVDLEEVGRLALAHEGVKRKGTEARPAWYVDDRLSCAGLDPTSVVIRPASPPASGCSRTTRTPSASRRGSRAT